MKEARKQPHKTGAPKTAKGAPFCLRLNTLRAICAAAVIMAHVFPFLELWAQFYSLRMSGHQAVYFFFALSGYLLTLSLIKEVKRRLNEDKSTPKRAEEETRKMVESQPPQMHNREKVETGKEPESPSSGFTECANPVPEITVVSSASGKEEVNKEKKRKKKENKSQFLGKALFQGLEKSPLICMLCKFLWNRIWRLFPLYFACSILLKVCLKEGETYHPGLYYPQWTWQSIFLLQEFPFQLWTMRLDAMFSFYVLPIYICALYGAFKLQKKGYEKVAKLAFAAILLACLFVAIYFMAEEKAYEYPVAIKDKFWENLPPYFWGMLMGFLNYALELEFNKRQQAKAKALAAAEKKENEEEEPIAGAAAPATDSPMIRRIWRRYILSVLYQHRYSIIFYAVLIRIAFLNHGFGFFFTDNNVPDSYWYSANWHSYWQAVFILINDSRGGFWKIMHTQPEPKPTVLHPTDFHRMVYYFGLYSYTIYLVHPVVQLRLGVLVGARRFTTEFVVLSVVLALPLAAIIDFLIDKMLVNKIILGKIVPSIGNMLVANKTAPAPVPEVDKPPYSKL